MNSTKGYRESQRQLEENEVRRGGRKRKGYTLRGIKLPFEWPHEQQTSRVTVGIMNEIHARFNPLIPTEGGLCMARG
jgi:hypothetical protein